MCQTLLSAAAGYKAVWINFDRSNRVEASRMYMDCRCPYWPRRMRIEKASAYLDMSQSAFMDRVRDGRLPYGYRDGAMRYWLIEDLDAAIDKAVAGYRPIVRDEFEEALERFDAEEARRKALDAPKARRQRVAERAERRTRERG